MQTQNTESELPPKFRGLQLQRRFLKLTKRQYSYAALSFSLNSVDCNYKDDLKISINGSIVRSHFVPNLPYTADQTHRLLPYCIVCLSRVESNDSGREQEPSLPALIPHDHKLYIMLCLLVIGC